jgi:hypothetical protein
MRDLTDNEIQNVYGAGGSYSSSYGCGKKNNSRYSRHSRKTRRTDYSRKNTRKTYKTYS